MMKQQAASWKCNFNTNSATNR